MMGKTDFGPARFTCSASIKPGGTTESAPVVDEYECEDTMDIASVRGIREGAYLHITLITT